MVVRVKITKELTIGDHMGIKGWPEATQKKGTATGKKNRGSSQQNRGSNADFHPRGVEFQPKHNCEILGPNFGM